MKMRLAALFALVLLLFGCGRQAVSPRPSESAASRLSVRAADGTTDFGSFSADAPDPSDADAAEALVWSVLTQYPERFPDQWGVVEILLVDGLTGAEQFSHGSYAGFTRRNADGWQMVLDVSACTAGTVHHEIAHILDGILTQSGVLTEETWMAFCPSGFAYGQGDFDRYPDFFADAYATQTIKEDRARTFEEAMLCGSGVFDSRPALWLKLEYFSRAIRDYFDTDGWPEKTAWEQALK